MNQWEQLGNMHNLKFQTFPNKNHPTDVLNLVGKNIPQEIIIKTDLKDELFLFADVLNLVDAGTQSKYK